METRRETGGSDKPTLPFAISGDQTARNLVDVLRSPATDRPIEWLTPQQRADYSAYAHLEDKSKATPAMREAHRLYRAAQNAQGGRARANEVVNQGRERARKARGVLEELYGQSLSGSHEGKWLQSSGAVVRAAADILGVDLDREGVKEEVAHHPEVTGYSQQVIARLGQQEVGASQTAQGVLLPKGTYLSVERMLQKLGDSTPQAKAHPTYKMVQRELETQASTSESEED